MCFVKYLGFQRCAFLFEERTADPLVSTLWTCAYPGTDCVCVEIDLALALKFCSFVVDLSYGLCIAQDIAYIFLTYYVQRSLRNIKQMPSTSIENGAKIHPRARGDPPWELLGLKDHNYPSNRLLKWTHE